MIEISAIGVVLAILLALSLIGNAMLIGSMLGQRVREEVRQTHQRVMDTLQQQLAGSAEPANASESADDELKRAQAERERIEADRARRDAEKPQPV